MIEIVVSRRLDFISLCLVTPRFATGLNSSQLPGRVPCFAELSTEFRKPEHWTEQELSAPLVTAAARLHRMCSECRGRESVCCEGAERVLNKLFIFSPDTFNHHTHLSDRVSAPASYLMPKLSGYFQTIEWIIHHWDWSRLSFVPCSYTLNPSYAKPNFAC